MDMTNTAMTMVILLRVLMILLRVSIFVSFISPLFCAGLGYL